MKKATRNYWFGGSLLFLLLAGSILYFTSIDLTYTKAECYADTGIRLVPKQSHTLAYVAKTGRMTLYLEVGERNGLITNLGYANRLMMDIANPTVRKRIELPSEDLQIGFSVGEHAGRMAWFQIGQGGVSGFLEILEIDSKQIRAEYDFIVDGYHYGLTPPFDHKTFTFQGQATFRFKAQPQYELLGDIWPKR
jgi:hypothetical protein